MQNEYSKHIPIGPSKRSDGAKSDGAKSDDVDDGADYDDYSDSDIMYIFDFSNTEASYQRWVPHHFEESITVKLSTHRVIEPTPSVDYACVSPKSLAAAQIISTPDADCVDQQVDENTDSDSDVED